MDENTPKSAQSLPEVLREHFGEEIDQYLLPPPAFQSMGGEVISVDAEGGNLSTRFPIQEDYLNPYRTLQGGFLAAMFDNTLGPLSMLVAPPNVTRRLEITYSQPIEWSTGWITITATLHEREGRRVILHADARDPGGNRLARAKATHWILDG